MRVSILVPALVCGLCLFGTLAGVSAAAEVAVVDTARIYADSKPGKAAAEHLKRVSVALQQGLDKVAAACKGRENGQEARQALAGAHAVLQRELAAQRQAVAAELNRLLTEAVRRWRTKNRGFVLVLPKQDALYADGGIEVTRAVMAELDRLQARFPKLPDVSVNLPVPGKSGTGNGGKKR